MNLYTYLKKIEDPTIVGSPIWWRRINAHPEGWAHHSGGLAKQRSPPFSPVFIERLPEVRRIS